MQDAYFLPPVDLLQTSLRGGGKIDREALIRRARELETAIHAFGLNATIVEMELGPLFTGFHVELPAGARMAQLLNMQDDLARVLALRSIQIEPVAGKSVVNVLLPNDRHDAVMLSELIASADFEEAAGSLPMLLGKTISGEVTCVDLSILQHLLIAGTTGSGKSMGLHGILLSLLYRLTPDRVRFILIDPKAVELGPYGGIPHLLADVVTDLSKAVRALRWAVEHMDDRYRMMAAIGVKSLDAFNAKITAARLAGNPFRMPTQRGYDADNRHSLYEDDELVCLPAIVIAIDDLGDVMMELSKEVDPLLQRLAQRGHRAGLHLILLAERPSAAIVGGAVKANLSSRIAYRVISAAESRIVLDEAGAEGLVGRGEMLFRAAGSTVQHIHGAFVSDAEIQAVADHWRSQGQPDYIDITFEHPAPAAQLEDDGLYEQAISIVLGSGKSSTAYIQRQLRISYNSAARIIERMERDGVIGAPDHVGRREIYQHGHEVVPDRPPTTPIRSRFRWPWER